MNRRRLTSSPRTLQVMVTFTALLCVLLGAHPAAQAISMYDASVSLEVSTWALVPFMSSLTLLPGITLTPPPFGRGNGTASRSATANVPGQVKASASGVAIGSVDCGLGECTVDDTFVSSRATAIGLGSLSAINNVSFPLAVHEKWSVSAFSNSLGAEANINFQILLDGAAVYSGAASATSGRFGQGTLPNFESNDETTRLRLALTPGPHSLIFTAEANGLAATPEPTTLLLFGTTAAGLAVARWKQRRRKHQQPAD